MDSKEGKKRKLEDNETNVQTSRSKREKARIKKARQIEKKKQDPVARAELLSRERKRKPDRERRRNKTLLQEPSCFPGRGREKQKLEPS